MMFVRTTIGMLCMSLVTTFGCSDGGSPTPSSTPVAPTTSAVTESKEDPKIEAALNELPEEDRALAKAQKFCAVAGEKGRLGSMGKPVKIMVEGQPVFLCCDGCEEEAQKNPQETLAKVEKLKEANK